MLDFLGDTGLNRYCLRLECFLSSADFSAELPSAFWVILLGSTLCTGVYLAVSMMVCIILRHNFLRMPHSAVLPRSVAALLPRERCDNLHSAGRISAVSPSWVAGIDCAFRMPFLRDIKFGVHILVSTISHWVTTKYSRD